MSTTQHEQEVSFETEQYNFKLYKLHDAPNWVQLEVEFKPPTEITEAHIREVMKFLSEIGKWEEFTTPIRKLLEDLGVVTESHD